MHTDESQMAQSAVKFDASAAQLKANMSTVESTGEGLRTQLRGQAGNAVQAALARYHEAMTASLKELNTISQNIRESGLSYGSSDADAAGTVQTSFHV